MQISTSKYHSGFQQSFFAWKIFIASLSTSSLCTHSDWPVWSWHCSAINEWALRSRGKKMLNLCPFGCVWCTANFHLAEQNMKWNGIFFFFCLRVERNKRKFDSVIDCTIHTYEHMCAYITPHSSMNICTIHIPFLPPHTQNLLIASAYSIISSQPCPVLTCISCSIHNAVHPLHTLNYRVWSQAISILVCYLLHCFLRDIFTCHPPSFLYSY